jgi:cation diffusion facilitator CzcD-associated flavoprotein CzcO
MTANGSEPVPTGLGEPPHVRVAVIGAGFGGLGAAIALRRAGIEPFVVLERRPGLGGTWWDNTYPGCACDVPSHLYSFSFAPNPRWARAFSEQPEIQQYLEEVADRFGVRGRIRLNTELLEARWDEQALRWRLTTDRGDLCADVVISATGPLSQPRLPDVPGLDTFRGDAFHSAAWRHDVDLTGKRVAVIGSGASALQIVPRIQPQVGRLFLFQRSAPWVLPKRDRPLDAREHTLFQRFPLAQLAAREAVYWGREATVPGFVLQPAILRAFERLARHYLERQVADPELRAALTPSYRMGCKRIVPSNDFYPAVTRPNVELITAGLGRLDGNRAVATDGSAREVDVVIFGTGFHVTDGPAARRIHGRDGQSLAEAWAADGMQALRGTTVAGFPNLFLVIGPNTGLGHSSMIFIIESQTAYIVDALSRMQSSGLAAIEPRRSAQQRWNDGIQRRMRRTVWATGCTSWYQDAGGRVTALWPASTWRFRRQTRRVEPREYRLLRPTGTPPSAPVPRGRALTG